jgi:hypothetical protein
MMEKHMEKKYTALRTIGTIYKVLGAIVAILTIMSAIGICVTSLGAGAVMDSFLRDFGGSRGGIGGFFGGAIGGLISALFTIIAGGGMALTFYAAGEGVYVLIDLEANTRRTSELLLRGAPPPPPPAP